MNIFVIVQQHLVFLCVSCRVYKVYLVLPPPHKQPRRHLNMCVSCKYREPRILPQNLNICSPHFALINIVQITQLVMMIFISLNWGKFPSSTTEKYSTVAFWQKTVGKVLHLSFCENIVRCVNVVNVSLYVLFL